MSLIKGKMQIRTTQYHSPPTARMALSKKTRRDKCQEMEKGNPNLYPRVSLVHCWKDCKMVQPLWKKHKEVPQKLKLELAYDPAISLLVIGINPKLIQKDTFNSLFIATLVTIAQMWKQPKCPMIDNWIKM